jgi:uncharacterized protein YqeY
MSLRDRIQADLKDAMRARDEVRVSTLRLIQAAIKDRDIAARAEDRCDGCGQEEILAILQKLLKQREESAQTYENAGRLDLAEREQREAVIVSAYLPEPMNPAQIADAAREIVDELEASSLKDMGKCMGALKERYAGRMDFSRAGKEVKSLLQDRA